MGWERQCDAARWSGQTSKIIAELEGAADLQAGLDEVLGMGTPVAETGLVAAPLEAADEIGDRLDRAREHIAAHWIDRLVREDDALVLTGESAPHPPDPDIGVEAGLATGTLLPWPRNSGN